VSLRSAVGAVVPERARPALRRLVWPLEVRAVRPGSSVVLGYHGVGRSDFDPWRLLLPPELFSEHLEALTKHYRPVSLRDSVEAAARGEPIHRGVTLTFEDGDRSFLDEIKPALERFGVPATMFMLSGYIDSGVDFWWDRLAAIAVSPRRPTTGSDELDAVHVDWALEPLDFCRALHEQLLPLPHARRSEQLDALATLAQPDATPPRTLSSDELVELADSDLIEIASHTVWHPRLSDLEPAEQLDELRRSRDDLEQLVGKPVTSFAFPHGQVSAAAVAQAREAGYTYVCTSAYAPLRAGASHFNVPRAFVYEKCHGDELAWRVSCIFRLGAAPDAT
jgi:peptidoglycan/xylan/chitin deacetylase (PgdA/CDA1 family)